MGAAEGFLERFLKEARHLITAEYVETYATIDLFRDHEAFVSVVSRLMEVDYHKVSEAQKQIDRLSARLYRISAFFCGVSVLLALILAVVTVRMTSHLIRGMEWQTAELGRVSWHMLEDQEATARRFSHELHDELGQSLTAVKTNLTALAMAPTPEPARLEDCIRLVDDSIGNVRQMSHLLRPTILDDFGLEAGVRWLCEGFSARTGIDVNFSSNYSGRLADDTETHLFRIAQEALTNIARHAEARHVSVRLERAGDSMGLTVQDDGRGLAPVKPAENGQAGRPAHLGMIGMRARARSAGGDVTVHSRAGEGVLIEVRVPFRDEKDSHSAG